MLGPLPGLGLAALSLSSASSVSPITAAASSSATTTASSTYGSNFRIRDGWLRLIETSAAGLQCCYLGAGRDGGGVYVVRQLHNGIEGVGVELAMCDTSTDLAAQLTFPQGTDDCWTTLAVFKLSFANIID